MEPTARWFQVEVRQYSSDNKRYKNMSKQVRYMDKAGKVNTIAVDDPNELSATTSYLQKNGWKLDDNGFWRK